MAALVLIGLPVFLLCLGVPIFVALIAAASIGIVAMGIGSMAPVHVALFGGLDNFPLLAVPLFIFAGEVMASSSPYWPLIRPGGVSADPRRCRDRQTLAPSPAALKGRSGCTCRRAH